MIVDRVSQPQDSLNYIIAYILSTHYTIHIIVPYYVYSHYSLKPLQSSLPFFNECDYALEFLCQFKAAI